MNLEDITKYNKSDIEKQILQIIHDLKNKRDKTSSQIKRKKDGCQMGGDWGMGEMDEGDQKIQTSIYKVNKSWACNVSHGDYS